MHKNKPMKTNKRYVLLFLLFLLTTITIAHAQTEVSIKAGVHYSNVIFEDASGDRQETQFTPGMHAGLSVDVPVSGAFYIQPGLLYSRKGFTQDDNWFAGAANDFKVSVNYIELPLNVLYKPSLGSGKLLLGAGPYLGYGTGGKWESDEPVVIGDIIHDDHGDVNFKNDVVDGEWGEYLYGKRWDYGANFTAGYEFFDQFSAQFNIRLGLANLEPDVDGSKPDGTFKNIGFGISLGYTL